MMAEEQQEQQGQYVREQTRRLEDVIRPDNEWVYDVLRRILRIEGPASLIFDDDAHTITIHVGDL